MIKWRVWFQQPHTIHRSVRQQRAFSVIVEADQLFNNPSGSAIFLREAAAAEKGAKGKADMIAYRVFNHDTFAEIHLIDDPHFDAKKTPTDDD